MGLPHACGRGGIDTTARTNLPDEHTSAEPHIHRLEKLLAQRQAKAALEYWAYLEALTLCCSNGRPYRFVEESSKQMVTMPRIGGGASCTAKR